MMMTETAHKSGIHEFIVPPAGLIFRECVDAYPEYFLKFPSVVFDH